MNASFTSKRTVWNSMKRENFIKKFKNYLSVHISEADSSYSFCLASITLITLLTCIGLHYISAFRKHKHAKIWIWWTYYEFINSVGRKSGTCFFMFIPSWVPLKMFCRSMTKLFLVFLWKKLFERSFRYFIEDLIVYWWT